MGQFFYFQNKLRHPYVIYRSTYGGFSRGCCHVAGSNIDKLLDSLADFSKRWQGIRSQGSSMYFYAPS